MDASEPLVRVEQLTKVLVNTDAGTSHHIAVDDLTILKGDFAVVTGPTGCGKSTLLNVLATLLPPTTVETYDLLGRDMTRVLRSDRALCPVRRRWLGIAPQQPELLSALTVHENVALPIHLNGGRNVRRRVNGLLAGFGAYDEQGQPDLMRLSSHRPQLLSGGQAQRVGLARAVAHGPGLLLADEPTSNLDPGTGQSVLMFLDALRQEDGLTILMVSHDEAVLPFATLHLRMDLAADGVGRLVEASRLPVPRPLSAVVPPYAALTYGASQ